MYDSARRAFAYLAERDPIGSTSVDAVMGFGVFDLRLAPFCGELYDACRAKCLIFSGGIGAGTADLGKAEADAWRDELVLSRPGFPLDHLIVENRSTNTGENVQYTAALLDQRHPGLSFGRGISSLVAVASPSRLRRVRLTLWRLAPGLRVFRQSPSADFAEQEALYLSKGFDFITHLAGELDRLITYSEQGWIAREPLPALIEEDRRVLQLFAEGRKKGAT